jgi:ligand-binding sensor domain-containing protein
MYVSVHRAYKYRRAVLALGILLACCRCAFALDPSLDVSQYAHTSWKIRDGFSKGAIHTIAQTPDGYLWLGTEFGLLRFGVNRGARAGHWGLPGMHERAKSFGGNLEVWSERGTGTEIRLVVPASIAYGKSEVRRKLWSLRKKAGGTDGHQS